MKSSVIVPIVLLLLVLLAPAAHAQSTSSQCGLLPGALAKQISSSESWYCPINQQIYSQWQNVLPIAVAAVLLAFAIASLIVMTGIALKSDRLRNFGIAEVYEAAASAIVVGIFLYLCAVMFGLAPAVVVGGINPYATALNLLSTTISHAQNLFNATFNVYYMDRFIVSNQLTLNIGGSEISALSAALEAAYVPISLLIIDPSRTILTWLADGIFGLRLTYYLMVFFSVASIPVFLIPGVIFRAFLPTRAFGGVLVAIGITFYLITPTLFAVTYYLTSSSVQQMMANAEAQLTRFSANPSTAATAPSADSPIVTQLQSIESSMNSLWIMVLFYPMLISSISYAAITQLTEFIGGSYRRVGKLRALI